MEFNFKSSDVAKHSAAHALAAAVKRIFPTVKLGLGPVTKSGFYYDFELERPLNDEDIELIEKNVAQVIADDLQFQQMVMPKNDGINMLLQIGQMYKVEVIKSIPEDQVSFFKLGEEFIDLCRGPHLKSTGEIGIVKITQIEETHWNNDPSRPVMFRVHGVVFQNIVEYNDYLQSVKLQDKRNVIKLSKDMNYIFSHESENYFTEEGSEVINSIRDFIVSKFNKDSNKTVSLPSNLNYKDAFKLIDKSISYKNLSYKIFPKVITAEIDHYDEKKGIGAPAILTKILMLNGKEIVQSGDFMENIIDITSYIAKQDINIVIRCKDLENKIVKSLSSLFQKRIISHNKILSNKIKGVAEMEVNVTDTVGKEWTLCRSFIPEVNEERISYTDEANKEMNVSEIGFYFDILSIYSYLVEEFEYQLPYRFKPTQVVCIPKSNNQIEYTTSINNHLLNHKIRSSMDLTARSLDAKVRSAEIKEVPFILIIGPKEETNNAVSVRNNNSEIGLISSENIIKFIDENKEKAK